MNQFIKRHAACFLCTFMVLLLQAQPKIQKVEYYIDNDPGYNNAINVKITSTVNLQNISVNINPNTLSTGVHLFGVRALDTKGAWSLDNKWLFVKQSTASNAPKINYAEYYIDTDPGYGKAKSISINSAVNLNNLTVNINPNTLSAGVHLFGVRALDAKGAWSLDNKWLFVKQATASNAPKISYAEYYVDTDPGYGNAKSINITSAVNLQNLTVNVNPNTLSSGVHLFGIRALDAKGAWSLDNKWLFVIQKPVAAVPDLKYVEYYIDKDPGYNKGTPVAINSVKNLPDFDLPINVSALKAGIHVLYIRSRDANGAWSLDNRDSFSIPSVINPATIVINSITSTSICAGGNLRVSYQANGNYDSSNVFRVQLSNKNGTFTNPAVIGTHAGKSDAIVNCIIPAGTAAGASYRLRVISTNPANTGLISDDTLTIKTAPSKPVITSVPQNTTDLCPSTDVTLTSSAANNNFWNTSATTKSITIDSAAAYYVTVTNTSNCSLTSDSTIVSYSACAKPVALKTKNITSTSATFSWKSAACAAKYKVQYRLAGATAYITATASDSFYVANGLTAATEYEWKVETVCKTSPLIVSGYTKLISFITAAAFTNATAENESNASANKLNAMIVPNPASSEAFIFIQMKTSKNISVSLSDVAGKVLWKAKNVSGNKIQLPVNSITNGTYLVTISDGLQKQTLKFIKQ